MKTVKFFITAGLLIATTAFGSVNTQALEVTETQMSSTTASNNSLSSCADIIKNIYTAQYPEDAEMINDIVDTISTSEEFIHYFECEGATAFQIIEDSLRDALIPSVSPRYVSNGIYRSRYTVPVIMQSKTWYCGPASVLQALYGNGDTTDTQDNIAAALGTTSGGTYITSISAYMRQKHPASSGYEYKAKAFTCYTYQNAIELVKKSLQQNAVPIIRVGDTSVLGYYNGQSYTHYMCISEVNTNNNTVTLVDPHFNATYRGTHVISMSEFEDLVNYDGWIALYTNAQDGYYVYE
ncbi:MAG: C39 family peptidase [Candidatus Ornithomonoglobus sp.]